MRLYWSVVAVTCGVVAVVANPLAAVALVPFAVAQWHAPSNDRRRR